MEIVIEKLQVRIVFRGRMKEFTRITETRSGQASSLLLTVGRPTWWFLIGVAHDEHMIKDQRNVFWTSRGALLSNLPLFPNSPPAFSSSAVQIS